MNIDNFLPYMRDVVRCETSLRELNLMWRVIEAMAEMNCGDDANGLLPMIAATRQGFERLERDLIDNLVRQRVDNVMAEVGTQARDVIDILVRNLYERTADVGFLATDRELCEYVAGLRTDRAAAVERLRAYRDKYTVYDEIILLDTEGAVLAHIDAHAPIEGSRDPLIRASLEREGYLETFRPSDLRPGGAPALIYSQRMCHPDTGVPVGVLCLVFAFNTEMTGIFAARHREDGRCNILLLDGGNQVLASADESWIPRGVKVPVNRSGQPELCIHGGRKYLTQTFAAKGYQGYPGPAGWQGQVMVPLEVAFDQSSGGSILAQLDEVIAEGLLSHAASFCPPLFEIIQAAETVRRVVWNGEVMAAGDQRDLRALKSVLGQISDNGARSNAVFAQSIRDLYDAALASNLESADFTARLMVDLLDRNLYERANDCRWWAMSPTLRQTLSDSRRPPAAVEAMGAILAHINSLYTVYTQLVVYDRRGRIVAASHPDDAQGTPVLGQAIAEAELARTLALRTEQDYHVSAFAPCPLYGERPTYVYHAAIRDPQSDAVVGGIGIVFDAEAELHAMLRDGLPDQAQAQAVYLDRTGLVLSSTTATHPIGARFALPADVLQLARGQSIARVVVRDDQYVVMAACVSSGYREYKVSDGYDNDVLAVCYWPLGEVRTAQLAPARRREAAQLERKVLTQCDQYATFFIDDSLLALPAASVLEALPATELKRVNLDGSPHRVGMLARQREGRIVKYLWVFDLFTLLGLPTSEDRASQVIVLRHGGLEVGLLVGDLHAVPAFEPQQLSPAPALGGSQQGLVSHLVRANGGKLLIQLLDPAALAERLRAEAQPTAH